MASDPARTARTGQRVHGFTDRAALLAALRGLSLKRSDLTAMFNCSRGSIGKLVQRPDFPPPFSASGDGKNLRWPFDEVLAWRDSHREAFGITARRHRPSHSSEEAVRRGVSEWRQRRINGTARFVGGPERDKST